MATAAKKSPITKRATTKKSVPELKDKTYKLVRGTTPLTYMLKTGRDFKLLVFDKAKGYERPIRHCPNESTIYADDQSKHALVDSITFVNGMLFVPKNKQITQQFLDANPFKGRIYEEVDREKEAKEAILVEEATIVAKQAVINKSKEEGGIHELESVVAVLTGSYNEASNMGIESLKRALFQEISMNPFNFVDEDGNVNIFEDEFIKRKYIAIRAENLGIIERSPTNMSFKWRNGDIFYTAPQGVILIDALAEFLGTDEGLLVLAEIKKRS